MYIYIYIYIYTYIHKMQDKVFFHVKCIQSFQVVTASDHFFLNYHHI